MADKKLFDAKGPFGNNVIKDPARYIYRYLKKINFYCHSCLACDNHKIVSFADWTQLQFSAMFVAAVSSVLLMG